MHWLNEPPEWRSEGDRLLVTTGPKTDFWRLTHYGFIRDNGHFYSQVVPGDFTAEVRINGDFQALYDQLGLMVRLDSRHWIKAGVEFTDGQPHLSAVVTHDYSDWSVLPIEHSVDGVWLRLTRHSAAIRVQYSFDGQVFRMLRLAYLAESAATMVGVMCCSPERAGFRAEFTGFNIREPISRDLHE
jgi:regulation of enolase protein 1 (concanavalin A-like superfamily)